MSAPLIIVALLTGSLSTIEHPHTPVMRLPHGFLTTPAQAAAPPPSRPQTPPSKGEWYASWGYNTAQYALVDIAFDTGGQNNDFTFSNAEMHDSKSWDIWNHPPTVPQYSLRVGKYFKPDWALELNFDHAKAILTQGQTVEVSGTLNGAPVDESRNVSDLVPEYQLNNGANFVLINLVRRWRLHGQPSHTGSVSVMAKAGAGFMIPHTQNIVLGQPNEEGFQFGGPGAGVEGVIRVHVFRTIYAELSQKGFYGHYRNIHLADGRADQDLWAYVTVMQFGTTFDFHAHKN
jgi:hypothetical protein